MDSDSTARSIISKRKKLCELKPKMYLKIEELNYCRENCLDTDRYKKVFEEAKNLYKQVAILELDICKLSAKLQG